ncbi:MAG: futalosine hydrolase [Gloeobacteraceae cyanobacterium ES-bin-316]|nr:futalosine hydrolase [Ferruginibacter sp.]
MQMLVVSATELEIAPFLSSKPSIDFLITGVGSPACIYQLQKKLHSKTFDLVIQAGIAGAFGNGLALGETVLVQKEIFADLGAIENNQLKSVFDMGLAENNDTPYTNGWLVNELPLLQKSNLKKVPGITVNTVSDNKYLADLYTNKYHAAVETMEGASLHYVCLQEKIPFLQLRSISNRVGERDKNKWEMQDAIQHLNAELVTIINLTTAG